MSILNKIYQFSAHDPDIATRANINFDTLTSFINDEYEGGMFYNVKSYGAKGDGSTNDTSSINSAIADANGAKKPLYFPPGTYIITPGGLNDIKVSIMAGEAFFQASDTTTDSYLIPVNFSQGRDVVLTGINGYYVDIGGVISNSTTVGTGLYFKQGARIMVRIRHGAGLKYAVHVDTTWTSGAPMPTIYENHFWLKVDSCGVGLQITTNNDAAGVPIDANWFYMGSSFNHSTACVRISAGTNSGKSDVHNNVFIHEMLECGQANSDGIVLTGICIDNTFIIYNFRGINGTGRYYRADANSTPNRWYTVRDGYDTSKWAFSSKQEIEAGTRRTQIFGMSTAGVVKGSTNYFPISGVALDATVGNVDIPISSYGELRNFRVKSAVAPGTGQTYTFTLMKNGAASSFSVTISDAATTGSDTTNTVSVAAGDTLAWRIVASAGTPNVNICSAGVDIYA